MLLCALLLLLGCENPDGDVYEGDVINEGDTYYYSGTSASASEAYFPVVDALSSASVLRINSHTMAYVGERTGSSYKLNKVDLNNPTRKVSQEIGGNVAVITASVDGSKIGLIQAVEHGYEAFAGAYTKIYDAQTLDLLKIIPLAPPAANGRIVEPLHHRDPSLSLTDKYAVVLTEDDGFFASGGVQQYVSVYDIAGNKGAAHINAFSGTAGEARGTSNPALGVGTLMGAVVHGDYIILGGSSTTSATAVLQINSSGDTLTVTNVTPGGHTDTAANHWLKDNGTYVLESKSNGKAQVWKWNGASAPTVVGIVDVNGNNTGSIQALSFDPEDPKIAYFYQKTGADNDTNIGSVYQVDLSDSSLQKTTLFKFDHWVFSTSSRGGPTTWYTSPLNTGLWTIEKQRSGGDTYFVFSGSYTYTPTGGSATTVGAVFTVKNPLSTDTFGGTFTAGTGGAADTGIADATGKVSLEPFTAPWATAVRTLKTFKSASGDVFFAAKNYTANGAASNYKLVLKKLN